MTYAKKSRNEKFYALMPVALQNVIFSLYGWRQARRRYGSFFREKLLELKQSEWWTTQAIREYQNHKLAEVVQDAYENVPYYQKTWRELGIHPNDIRTIDDLSKLPVLSKEVVKARQSEFINKRFNTRNLVTNLTSGTTGTPLNVSLTPEALQFQWAVWWRHRARFGVQLGDRFLMFGARLPVPIEQSDPPFWRTNKAINQVYLSSYHIAPHTVEAIVDWLNREDFIFYTGYPSAMYALTQLMNEKGLKLTNPPHYVITGSDALLPAFEEAIQSTFGAPVTEQYGMAEACGNLAKCELGTYHLDFEFCIMEQLPIPDVGDSPYRRLIFTGLANPAMPLIRYDVGDYGHIIEDEACACGRQSPILHAIDGRVEEYIRTPDGRRIMGLNQAFEWASGVRETQIVQNKVDAIDVNVLPGSTFNLENDLTILEAEFRNRLGHDMQINFKVVDSIPRKGNGKFRAVISNLHVRDAGEQALRAVVNEDSR